MTLISSSNGNSNLLTVDAFMLKVMNECYVGTSRSEAPSFGEMCFASRLIVQPPETVQIRFQIHARRYKQVKTVLKMMIPSIALDVT